MQLLTVMYHFVHQPGDPLSSIPGISTKELEQQIQFLLQENTPVKLSEIIDYFTKGIELPQKSFYLTFDDGIAQHYHNAFPILKKYGLEAAFYPITLPLTDEIVPVVEKQRYLQYIGFPTYKDFLSGVMDLALEQYPELRFKNIQPTAKNLDRTKDYLKEHPFYTLEERFYRYVRDQVFTLAQFEKIIEEVFARVFSRETEFVRKYYMNSKELKDLVDSEMIVGCHTHTHQLLPKMSNEALESDLDKSFFELAKIINAPIRTMAYPNGLWDERAVKMIKEKGVEVAFETGNKIVSPLKGSNPLVLTRVDANGLSLNLAKKVGNF